MRKFRLQALYVDDHDICEPFQVIQVILISVSNSHRSTPYSSSYQNKPLAIWRTRLAYPNVLSGALDSLEQRPSLLINASPRHEWVASCGRSTLWKHVERFQTAVGFFRKKQSAYEAVGVVDVQQFAMSWGPAVSVSLGRLAECGCGPFGCGCTSYKHIACRVLNSKLEVVWKETDKI